MGSKALKPRAPRKKYEPAPFIPPVEEEKKEEKPEEEEAGDKEDDWEDDMEGVVHDDAAAQANYTKRK